MHQICTCLSSCSKGRLRPQISSSSSLHHAAHLFDILWCKLKKHRGSVSQAVCCVSDIYQQPSVSLALSFSDASVASGKESGTAATAVQLTLPAHAHSSAYLSAASISAFCTDVSQHANKTLNICSMKAPRATHLMIDKSLSTNRSICRSIRQLIECTVILQMLYSHPT